MTGRLVTVDGPGGTGKSTLVASLAALLAERGERVHATREPSERAIGKFTRDVVNDLSGLALACLVAADRYDHVANEIRPQLEDGATVICDRYVASSLVLQRRDEVPLKFLLDLNSQAPAPDLAVILTADPETIAGRIASRGAHDRFEHDPLGPARDIAYYADAADSLIDMGVRVLVLDVSHRTPQDAAEHVALALAVHLGAPAAPPTHANEESHQHG